MEAEARHYLVNGGGEQPEPREALEWAGQTQAQTTEWAHCPRATSSSHSRCFRGGVNPEPALQRSRAKRRKR